MLKMVVLLVRADEYTHEAFVDYWETEHAPLADDLPNCERYATSVPTRPEDSAYDGIAELYFEDMDALSAAFESEAGEALMADAEAFADMDESETMYVEETVQFDAD